MHQNQKQKLFPFLKCTIIKCKNKIFHLFTPKQDFVEKLTNVTSAYLLCTIIQLFKKKILRVNRVWLLQFNVTYEILQTGAGSA